VTCSSISLPQSSSRHDFRLRCTAQRRAIASWPTTIAPLRQTFLVIVRNRQTVGRPCLNSHFAVGIDETLNSAPLRGPSHNSTQPVSSCQTREVTSSRSERPGLSPSPVAVVRVERVKAPACLGDQSNTPRLIVGVTPDRVRTLPCIGASPTPARALIGRSVTTTAQPRREVPYNATSHETTDVQYLGT
jgi:hypothetical protein